jgi:hypothetical protein
MSPPSAANDLRGCSPTPAPEIVGKGAQTDLRTSPGATQETALDFVEHFSYRSLTPGHR